MLYVTFYLYKTGDNKTIFYQNKMYILDFGCKGFLSRTYLTRKWEYLKMKISTR